MGLINAFNLFKSPKLTDQMLKQQQQKLKSILNFHK